MDLENSEHRTDEKNIFITEIARQPASKSIASENLSSSEIKPMF